MVPITVFHTVTV